MSDHKGGNEEEEDKQMEAEDRRFQKGWDSHEGRGEPWDHRGEVGKKIKKGDRKGGRKFFSVIVNQES